MDNHRLDDFGFTVNRTGSNRPLRYELDDRGYPRTVRDDDNMVRIPEHNMPDYTRIEPLPIEHFHWTDPRIDLGTNPPIDPWIDSALSDMERGTSWLDDAVRIPSPQISYNPPRNMERMPQIINDSPRRDQSIKKEDKMQIPEGVGHKTNDELKQCVICTDMEKDCVILDCGHICSCAPCFRTLVGNSSPTCPLCRKDIKKGAIRTYS